jgi:hypothetical protein
MMRISYKNVKSLPLKKIPFMNGIRPQIASGSQIYFEIELPSRALNLVRSALIRDE